MELREQVEREARAAQAAVPLLTDEASRARSSVRRALVDERRDAIARGERRRRRGGAELDEGALDRLRLDDAAHRRARRSSSRSSRRCRRSSARRTSWHARQRTAGRRCGGSRSARSARTSRRGRTSRSTSRGSCSRALNGGGAPHGRRGAAYRDVARRRGAAAGARRRRDAAARPSGSSARRTARARGSSSRCRTSCRS